MEYENKSKPIIEHPYKFLDNEDVKNKFADLNIQLLNGRHIQNDTYHIYQLVKTYYEEFKYYYASLYDLVLERDFKDTISFYYLDFNKESKGALSSSKRHKELTKSQTLFGIILLNMYYDRYFESEKEITFQDIKKEIEESENSSLYKQLFFNDIRDIQSPPEWKRVIKALRSTLREFNKLGWIEYLSKKNDEELHFKLKESIYRFQRLYEKEIINFEEFTQNYLLETND